jgi:hypothetical protein
MPGAASPAMDSNRGGTSVIKRPPPRPERSEVRPEDLEAYDFVLARLESLTEEYRTSGPGSYHAALLNAPQAAMGLNRMGAIARTGSVRGSYSDAERELCDVVLSVDFAYNGVLPIHLPDMFAVGVRPDAIDAIREGREEDLEPDERQLVEYIRAVTSGAVTDELFDGMVQRLGLSGAVDYTAFVCFLIATMRMWSAMGVRNPPNEEIDQLLADLRSGKAKIPDPEAHLR